MTFSVVQDPTATVPSRQPSLQQDRVCRTDSWPSVHLSCHLRSSFHLGLRSPFSLALEIHPLLEQHEDQHTQEHICCAQTFMAKSLNFPKAEFHEGRQISLPLPNWPLVLAPLMIQASGSISWWNLSSILFQFLPSAPTWESHVVLPPGIIHYVWPSQLMI